MKRHVYVIVQLVSTLLIASCQLPNSYTATTVQDVKRQVDEALPIGATRQEIEAWLNSQGIDFSFSDQSDHDSIVKSYPPQKSSSGFICYLIRDTDRSFWVTGNIQVYFLLGTDSRLTEKVVKWIG